MSAAGAEFVYLMPTYRLLTQRDVVPLFAPASCSVVVGTREQKQYYARKLASRKYVIQWCNPFSWVKVLEARLKGPNFWDSEVSHDGFTTWTRR